ncbi:MAG TPA: hypothetical protein ENK33_05935 [Desulfobacterales bacterium]|nr:hypothetical protein [Desulfobacterales bacterium]
MNINSLNSLNPSQLYQNTADSQNAPQAQRTQKNTAPRAQSRVEISRQARQLQQQAATQRREEIKAEQKPEPGTTAQARGSAERNQVRQAETAAGSAKGQAINLVA